MEDWKDLSLELAARPIQRIPARRFYMNPEQEIELVLRVLSTQPTDEEIFHLEHEDVNPRKVEQEPEEKPEEEPVPLPVSRRRPALIDFLQNHLPLPLPCGSKREDVFRAVVPQVVEVLDGLFVR